MVSFSQRSWCPICALKPLLFFANLGSNASDWPGPGVGIKSKVFQSSLPWAQTFQSDGGGVASLFSLPICWRPVGGASTPCLHMIMRGGVYAWMLSPWLEQIREEMKKKKNLPQGKVTSVFLTFFLLAGVLYKKKKKKRADSPEYFLFF